MEKLTNENFEEKVLGNNKVVLVDFFATWCGPCKMLTPILEQVSENADGKFEVFKVDVDECFEVAKQYGIMSVPTMIVFKNGEIADKMVGLRSKKDIEEAITKLI